MNPHLEGPRCTRYAPSIRCTSREEAQGDGSMFYSDKYAGWIYPAENGQVTRVLREKWFAPYVWTFCPFCSGALPEADSPIERLLKPPPDYGEGQE